MTASYDEACGQRAVLTQANTVEYDAADFGRRDPGGHVSGSCIEPKRISHRDHRDADGQTWTESVR